MKTLQPCWSLLALLLVGALAGCSTSTKSADVSSQIRSSLDQAGFKNVSASQDRDKGVVTLAGHVPADRDKAQAESIARSIAGSQVVYLDKGIMCNLDAALIQDRLHDSVKYAVKNHVVTLTGEVDSQSKRTRAEQVASAVLNVNQVVNELQVKEQKASSSN